MVSRKICVFCLSHHVLYFLLGAHCFSKGMIFFFFLSISEDIRDTKTCGKIIHGRVFTVHFYRRLIRYSVMSYKRRDGCGTFFLQILLCVVRMLLCLLGVCAVTVTDCLCQVDKLTRISARHDSFILSPSIWHNQKVGQYSKVYLLFDVCVFSKLHN